MIVIKSELIGSPWPELHTFIIYLRQQSPRKKIILKFMLCDRILPLLLQFVVCHHSTPQYWKTKVKSKLLLETAFNSRLLPSVLRTGVPNITLMWFFSKIGRPNSSHSLLPSSDEFTYEGAKTVSHFCDGFSVLKARKAATNLVEDVEEFLQKPDLCSLQLNAVRGKEMPQWLKCFSGLI